VDIFGFRNIDVEEQRRRIEAALDICMELKDNRFAAGGKNHLAKSESENYRLVRNFDEVKNKWFRAEFKEMAVLLFINARLREDEIRERLLRDLDDIVFLQREIVTKDRRIHHIRTVDGRDTVVADRSLDQLLERIAAMCPAKKAAQ
jgi:hypothetical protein